MVQPLWKTVGHFLIKLKILLSYDLPVPLLSIYSKEIKNSIHAKTYTQTFIAALSIITQNWQQPKYPSVIE